MSYHDHRKVTKLDSCFLKKDKEDQITKVKKYSIVEIKGIIFVWLHAKDAEPFYTLPELNFSTDTVLTERAETKEYINCHMQEIPENGADWKHFKYVHYYLFLFLVPWVQFDWNPLCRRADSPDFDEVMTKHAKPKVREF